MILKAAFLDILQYAYIDVKPRVELIIPSLTKKIILQYDKSKIPNNLDDLFEEK